MAKNNPPSLVQKFVGEGVGTYLLVTIVIAAYFMAVATNASSLTYAVVYGATLAMVILFLGKWSRQFNPIVSLLLFVIRQQNLATTVTAIAGQIVGALLAGLTVRPLIELAQGQVEALVPTLTPDAVPLSLVTTVEGFGIVFLLLAYVWVANNKDEKAMDLLPWLAGLSVLPGAVVGMVVSGAALNPVRVLGPALIAGGDAWAHHWVFWVGPLIALLVVAVLVGTMNKSDK